MIFEKLKIKEILLNFLELARVYGVVCYTIRKRYYEVINDKELKTMCSVFRLI